MIAWIKDFAGRYNLGRILVAVLVGAAAGAVALPIAMLWARTVVEFWGL